MDADVLFNRYNHQYLIDEKTIVMKLPKNVLIEIFESIPDDTKVDIKSLEVIFNAYARGFEDAQCGFEGEIKHAHAAIEAAYQAGYELSKNSSPSE